MENETSYVPQAHQKKVGISEIIDSTKNSSSDLLRPGIPENISNSPSLTKPKIEEKDVEYANFNFEISKEGIYTLVKNSKELHSQITSSSIFKNTNKELIVYTKGFRTYVENTSSFDFLKNLLECIDRVEQAYIFVDDCESTGSRSNVYEAVQKKYHDLPSKVHFYKLTTQQSTSIQDNLKQEFRNFLHNPIYGFSDINEQNAEFHFIVGDGKKYRLEYDSHGKKADVNYNDSTIGGYIRNSFYNNLYNLLQASK